MTIFLFSQLQHQIDTTNKSLYHLLDLQVQAQSTWDALLNKIKNANTTWQAVKASRNTATRRWNKLIKARKQANTTWRATLAFRRNETIKWRTIVNARRRANESWLQTLNNRNNATKTWNAIQNNREKILDERRKANNRWRDLVANRKRIKASWKNLTYICFCFKLIIMFYFTDVQQPLPQHQPPLLQLLLLHQPGDSRCSAIPEYPDLHSFTKEPPAP